MISAYRKPILFTALATIIAFGLWPALHGPAMAMDEGMMLVYPEMLLKGQLPYRDFEMIYGPGNIGILAAAYSIFGTNIFVERAVGMIYRVLILLAIFGIAQRWSTPIAAGCILVTGVLLAANDVMASTWMAGVAFALCSLWIMASVKSAWRSFTAGIFAGISLLSRCDFGPALIASTLPLFLLMEPKMKKKFVAGAALALLPLLWLTIVIGPAQIFHSLFLFPVFRLTPGRHLPILTASGDMLCLFYFHITAGVINIVAGSVALRDESVAPRGRLLLGVGILSLGLVHYALQRFDSGHVLNASFIALGLLPLSIFVLVSAMAKALPMSRKWVLPIVTVIVAIHLLLPVFTRYFYRNLRVDFGLSPPRQASRPGEVIEAGDKGIFVERNGRAFPFGFDYAARDADGMLTELARVSAPGQRLFVGPGDLRLTNYCDTYIYHMLPHLRPATYFLEMNPDSANALNSRLAADVESADWLVLNRRWDFLNESNRSTQFGSNAPNEAVHKNFDLWWECGSYLLFRNKKLFNIVVAPPPSRPP